MKLTIGERLKALQVLPANNDIVNAKIILGLQNKLGLKEKEKEYHKFRITPDEKNNIIWQWDKSEKEYDVDLSKAEKEIIKSELITLNGQKKLEVSKAMVSLYDKVVK
jgi:hypothetical protein